MFLRANHREKDGKRHTYWSLVETVRTADGPRQRTLCHLGELNDSAQARWLKTIDVFNDAGERHQHLVGTRRSTLRHVERALLEGTWTQVRDEVEAQLVPIPGGTETFVDRQTFVEPDPSVSATRLLPRCEAEIAARHELGHLGFQVRIHVDQPLHRTGQERLPQAGERPRARLLERFRPTSVDVPGAGRLVQQRLRPTRAEPSTRRVAQQIRAAGDKRWLPGAQAASRPQARRGRAARRVPFGGCAALDTACAPRRVS